MSILSQQKQLVNTDFPNIRPSLDLRFALAKKLDPRITFTRGSTGTYFGPDGLMKTAGVNEPRFDHGPVTGQSLGLLIEESRQNLLTYSNDFSNPAWIYQGFIPSYNNMTGLDGTSSASTFNAIPGFNYIYQSFTCSASTTYTFSFYVRLGTLPASSYKIAVYNNTASSFIAADVTPTQTLSSSSWTRVSYTFTTPVGCVSARVYPYRFQSGNSNGTFYLWGTQLEAGAFPTTYIPTVASTVTRSADLANMTGSNFLSWYNQTEGTVVMDLRPNYASGGSSTFRRLLSINNGSGLGQDNVIQVIVAENINTSSPALWNNSVFQAGGSTTILPNTSGKVAIAVSPNYVTSAGKGLISDRDRSAILPIMNRMDIGGYGGLSFYTANATISRITYYPIALTPSQLINLTS
jgi:hypothetical protein